jgi:quercetin dioxygenase-like cupin family protein
LADQSEEKPLLTSRRALVDKAEQRAVEQRPPKPARRWDVCAAWALHELIGLLPLINQLWTRVLLANESGVLRTDSARSRRIPVRRSITLHGRVKRGIPMTNGQKGHALLPGETRKSFEMDPGRLVIIKASATDTNGSFAALEETVPPGFGPDVHAHDIADEIIYVLEGRFRFRVADRLSSGGSGTFVFVPKTIPHAWVNVSRDVGRLLFVLFPAGHELYLEKLSRLPAAQRDAATMEALQRQYRFRRLGPPLDAEPDTR